MAVTYFGINVHTEQVFLLSRVDDGPIEMCLAVAHACRCCGSAYMALPPLSSTPDLLTVIRSKDRPLLSNGLTGQEMELFVAGPDSEACPRCGWQIRLPVPELLDAERTEFGRYVIRRNTRNYPDHPRNTFSWKRPGTWKEPKP